MARSAPASQQDNLLAVSSARADATARFIHAHRRRRQFRLFDFYVGAIVATLACAFAHGTLVAVLGHGPATVGVALYGPAVLLLIVLASARFGTWQGPVSFGLADIMFLALAPIAVASLVRPRLDRTTLVVALGAGLFGVVAVFVMRGGPHPFDALRAVATAAAGAAFGTLSISLSWLVEASRRGSNLVRSVTPIVVVVGVILLGAGLAGAPGVGLWSGPWGWAIMALVGARGWPLALVALVLLATATFLAARRAAASVSVERLAARASTRSSITTSIRVLDYRSATLAHRAPTLRHPASHITIPLPRASRLTVPWRDAVAFAHGPARLGWATLLSVGSTCELLAHDGRIIPTLLAVLGLYWSATILSEPARVDIDQPTRSHILFARPFGRVLRSHSALPALALWTLVTAGACGALTFGVTRWTNAIEICVLAPMLALSLTMATILTARRGGRIDAQMLTKIYRADLSNPAAPLVLFWLLAPWLLVTLAVDVIALLVGGVAVHRGQGLGAPLTFGLLMIAALTLILNRVLARTRS